MFDTVGDLKDRLESEAIEYYEKWDLQDTCGWLVAEDTNLDDFMAGQATVSANEERVVGILEALQGTADTIPLPLLQKVDELRRSVGGETYGKVVDERIQAVGFGIYPADATEFVKALMCHFQK